ncbi:MAG: hypothetical protein ABI430_01125 [Candidatus Taylorbacteria bacterium]
MSISKEREKNKSESDTEFEEISYDEVEKYYPKDGASRGVNAGGKFWSENRKDILTIGIIFLVGTGSYGLGQLSKIESGRAPVRILNSETAVATPSPQPSPEAPASSPVASPQGVVNANLSAAVVSAIPKAVPQAGMLVGAKSGDKYHFPWCSGAQRIKEENKIWFASVEEARKAGYTPAANCKGLK